MNKELLRMEDITAVYDDRKILKGARLNLFKGEIIGIIGVNYSGKTALAGGLVGLYSFTEGRIYLKEEPVWFNTIEQARDAGLFYIQKKSSLISDFTILENFMLAARGKKLLINKREIERDCKEALELIGIQADIHDMAGMLSYKNRVLIEIAKAIFYNAEILILDNVLNGLSDTALREFISLFNMLLTLHISIILVDTGIKYVKPYCSRLFIMRGGITTAVLDKKYMEENLIVSIMLGHKLKEKEENILECNPINSDVLLRFEQVSYGSVLHGLTFEVHKTEQVGILNVNKNSGRAIRDILIGEIQQYNGGIFFEGEGAAPKMDIVTIPETDIIFPDMSIEENIVFSALKIGSRLGIMNRHELKYIAGELISEYIQKDKSILIKRELVPKNRLLRKKIVFCRALATNPKLIVFVNPTQSIDLTAKGIIHKDIQSLKEKGIASLVISSDVEELLAVCERIIVINQGRVDKIFPVNSSVMEKLVYAYGSYLKNV